MTNLDVSLLNNILLCIDVESLPDDKFKALIADILQLKSILKDYDNLVNLTKALAKHWTIDLDNNTIHQPSQTTKANKPIVDTINKILTK